MRKRDKKELRKKERKRERGRQMYFTAKCNVTRDILWGETGKFSRSQKCRKSFIRFSICIQLTLKVGKLFLSSFLFKAFQM